MGGIFIFLIVRNVKHFTDFGVAFSSSHFCRIPDSLLEQVQQLHIAGSSTSYGKKQLPFSQGSGLRIFRHIVRCPDGVKVFSYRSYRNRYFPGTVTVVGCSCHIITAKKNRKITAAQDFFPLIIRIPVLKLWDILE